MFLLKVLLRVGFRCFRGVTGHGYLEMSLLCQVTEKDEWVWPFHKIDNQLFSVEISNAMEP